MSSEIVAYKFDAYGNAADVIYQTKVPKPSIKTDTEVLVKIKAACVNPADLLFVGGWYNIKAESYPSPAGFEAAGIIEEAGKSSGFNKGQRVHIFCTFPATWSEYAVIDTKIVTPVPLPDNVSFEEGAQITVNPITALGMIDTLGVKKGEYLLQTAASSALGRIIIKFAKLQGIKTINVVRRDEHIEALKAIGADYVINSEKEDLVKRVREIVPGGVKYAVDSVAGKVGTDVVNSLASRGTVLVYGLLSGKPIEVDAVTLIFQRPTVTGFWVGPWIQEEPEKAKAAFKEVVESLKEKKIELEFKTFDGKTQMIEAIKHSTTPGKAEKTIVNF